MSKEFIKSVRDNLEFLCGELGYRKFYSNHVKAKNESFFSSVSYSHAAYRNSGYGYVDINIVVGFRFNDLEHVLKSLEKEIKIKKVLRNTAGINIGYLMPTADYFYHTYVFVENEDKYNATVLEQIKSDIVEYAYPFYDRFSTLESIVSLFERRGKEKGDPVLFPEFIIEALPVLYYMQGSKEKALEYINEAVKNYKKSDRPFLKEDWLHRYSEEELDEYVENWHEDCDPNYYFFVKNFKQLPERYEDWKRLNGQQDDWYRKFIKRNLHNSSSASSATTLKQHKHDVSKQMIFHPQNYDSPSSKPRHAMQIMTVLNKIMTVFNKIRTVFD